MCVCVYLQEESIHQIIDPELEAIKARVKEMEEEAEKLKQMQSEVNKQMTLGSPTGTTTIPLSLEEKKEIDDRSIYVGNVDYGATAEELEAHFHGCGSMNRVTILCNKSDGHPKGFAYIEFGSKDFVETALGMNESLFRGRQIKVSVFFFFFCFTLFLVSAIRIDINFFSRIFWECFRLCQNEPIGLAYRRQTDFLAVSVDADEELLVVLAAVMDHSVAHGDQCELAIIPMCFINNTR